MKFTLDKNVSQQVAEGLRARAKALRAASNKRTGHATPAPEDATPPTDVESEGPVSADPYEDYEVASTLEAIANHVGASTKAITITIEEEEAAPAAE